MNNPNVDKQKWKVIEVGASSSYHDISLVSKNYSYTSKNYLGKNPKTRNQWRRNRHKKSALEAEESSNNGKSPTLTNDPVAKRSMKERLFPLCY